MLIDDGEQWINDNSYCERYSRWGCHHWMCSFIRLYLCVDNERQEYQQATIDEFSGSSGGFDNMHSPPPPPLLAAMDLALASSTCLRVRISKII